MAFSLNARTRLLVIAPHPDDESIATGELIQQVRQLGGEVRILLLTNGDNNPWPQRWVERRLRIGADDRRRWGERRRNEVGHALTQLGVDVSALQAAGWPDMGVTDLLRADLKASIAVILAALDAARPNLVAMPALGDHHPDHSAAHVITRLALEQWQGPAPERLAYLVHGREDHVTGRVKLDSSVGVHANKLAALACHRSQMALSGKRMRRMADRAERYLQVRGSGAVAPTPVLPWQPSAALQSWLHLMVVDGQGERSWPWRQAPLVRDGQGRYVLHAFDDKAPGPAFAKLYMNLPSPWIFDRWGWCEL
ncbi:PIG-L deacetylase family protein [Dyella amyloliquefaciens]|uniref:PIG-L deacetylase family protein n=1 Tax=Dyella amyloliquefaciens TaxID=1770545 RepID=UPI00102E5D7A|nr:PIG-L family deacetylase [Dyella amyloliquefaciens]